jgi:hypothetical protein
MQKNKILLKKRKIKKTKNNYTEFLHSKIIFDIIQLKLDNDVIFRNKKLFLAFIKILENIKELKNLIFVLYQIKV